MNRKYFQLHEHGLTSLLLALASLPALAQKISGDSFRHFDPGPHDRQSEQ